MPSASYICLTASFILLRKVLFLPPGEAVVLSTTLARGQNITFSRKAENITLTISQNITLAKGQNITQNPLSLSSLSARKALSFAQLYEIVVDAAPIQQLFMCALFGDFPFGHDDDLIRRADGI